MRNLNLNSGSSSKYKEVRGSKVINERAKSLNLSERLKLAKISTTVNVRDSNELKKLPPSLLKSKKGGKKKRSGSKQSGKSSDLIVLGRDGRVSEAMSSTKDGTLENPHVASINNSGKSMRKSDLQEGTNDSPRTKRANKKSEETQAKDESILDQILK